MRRSSLFLALTMMLVLSFGLAQGQSLIYVTGVTGLFNPTTLKTGTTITWTVALRNLSGGTMLGSNNGFRITDNGSGSNWPLPVLDTLNIAPSSGAGWKTRYDGGVFKYAAPSNDGLLADTVGIGGFNISGPGFPNGFDFDVLTITLPGGVADANDGKSICLDSSGYDVNTVWLWATTVGGVTPAWSGKVCYTLFHVPNQGPNITNCQTSLSFNHCNLAQYDFDARDQDSLGARPLTFVKIAGVGAVNLNTGVWTYAPTLADVGASLSVEVAAQDDPGNYGTHCTVSLTFTNVCPTFTAGCGVITAVGKGNSGSVDMNALSNDCDPISFSIVGVAPPPFGTYSIDPGTGVITFNTLNADGGILYDFTVRVSDTKCNTDCHTFFNVLVVEPYEVQIEKTHKTMQGAHELVCVTLNKGSEEMWGFDFLIAYDNSALSLVAALEGDIYTDCGWEYFNYRFGANGNCHNACPSGLVRVVGLAETNNGPNHPSCYLPPSLPEELFCLDFLVSNDRTLECQYVPIRFFWVDCGDNTISFNPSDDPTGFVQRLAVSRGVYDFDLIGNIANGSVGFPTFQGAQDICLAGGGDGKPAPIRFIDFINGGIDIVCSDSIDARGDINLNGVSNEVADAVLFTNYFIYGIGVFTVNVAGQIAATDVNVDGLTLSVADLVYLIRIVIGDAQPYPKLAPVETIVQINAKGTLSVADVQVGAASVVLSGNVEPTLLATNMKLEYAYDGANNVTRALVYSMEKGQSFTGEFLNIHGADIVGIEMATYEGAPILAKEVELPTSFALNQNYPNPFNPKTRISFALPTASDYTLTIYNVTGQKVYEVSNSAPAGTVDVSWDASNQASGVYFYKLIADNGKFTDTKKMVLVK